MKTSLYFIPETQNLDRGFSLVKKAGSFISPDLANDFVMAISTSGRRHGENHQSLFARWAYIVDV